MASASASASAVGDAEWVSVNSTADLERELRRAIASNVFVRLRLTRAYRATLGLDADTVRRAVVRATSGLLDQAPLVLPEEDLPDAMTPGDETARPATYKAHEDLAKQWRASDADTQRRWRVQDPALARLLTAREPALDDWERLSARDASPVARRALGRWVARSLHARALALTPGSKVLPSAIPADLLRRARRWADRLESDDVVARVPELDEAVKMSKTLDTLMLARV